MENNRPELMKEMNRYKTKAEYIKNTRSMSTFFLKSNNLLTMQVKAVCAYTAAKAKLKALKTNQ